MAKKTLATPESSILERYSMMEDDWAVPARDTFVSPMVDERPGQMLMFGERLRNGSISADITILDTLPRRNGEPSMEVSLVARPFVGTVHAVEAI